MTNGEKLQSIFPNIIKYGNILIDDTGALQKNILFDDSWWNSDYKEPTTKNDLGIEHHKQNIQAYAHDFGVSEEQAEKELKVTTKNDEVIEGCECFTCKYGDWKRKGWSLDMADDKCGGCCSWSDKYEPIEPTTKNDVPHCQYTDAEIAKSFIEDVEAVKEHLPCGEQMDFPNTFDEFVNEYGFKDKQEVYTNGSELIQVFRVKQWLEHIATTKNDLAVDCINRAELFKAMDTWDKFGFEHTGCFVREPKDDCVKYVHYEDMVKCVKGMPSVTPQCQEEHNKLERIKEIMSHEWSCWTPNYIQRVLDGTEDRY